MERHLLRRFRRELRLKGISADAGLILTDDDARRANTAAAVILLEKAFNGRLRVEFAVDGLLVGSREEAAANNLSEYTNNVSAPPLLLSSLSRKDIVGVLAGSGVGEVFVPDCAEVRFIERLAESYPDVLYGL